MANHKSSLKRIRQDKKKNLHNRYYAKTMRNAVRKLRAMTDKEEAVKMYPSVQKILDKLAKTNLIHKNKAGKNAKVNMVLDGIEQGQGRTDLHRQLRFLRNLPNQPFLGLFKEMQTAAGQIPLLMAVHIAAFHFVLGTTQHQCSIFFYNDSFHSHRKIPFHRIASFRFLSCFFQ